MSDVTVKFSFVHGLLAAIVLLTGGGGAFAAFRRRAQQAVEADPEAIELVVTAAVDGGVAIDDGEAAEATD